VVDAAITDGATADGPCPGGCNISPCLTGVCNQGRCAYTPAAGACDDGITCTRNDVCTAGVCTGGAWDTTFGSCATMSAPIYRSIGPTQTMALAFGTSNALRIRGETATFAGALPDRVGVGDVIQYDANDDDVVDSLAFIHARTSATQYTVRDAVGGTPRPTYGDDVDWALLRAYGSLTSALAMSENPGLVSGLRDFEQCGPSCDLVARHRSYRLAAYADAVDDPRVFIRNWRGDASNWLTIYTPTAASEVGVSQRHNGTWGSGYRRSSGIDVEVPFVRMDGLSLRVTAADRVYLIGLNAGRPGPVEIAHSYAEMANTSTWYRVYDVYGTDPVVFKVWNSIGVSRSTANDSYVFYNNQSTSQAYFYNCTGMVVGGAVFYQDQGPMEVVNGVGVVTGAGGRAYGGLSSPGDSITFSIASDSTLDAWPGQGNYSSQTVQFVNAAGGDFHLAPGDSAAKGRGNNLTANPTITVGDDIDGQPRPATPTPWDCGADEIP